MFITQEDPNAILKGSRDPLGLVPVRSALGRHIISARGFMILILGRYLAKLLTDTDRTNSVSPIDVFLRFEQLCAYIRHIAHRVEGDIRGIESVRKRSRTMSKIPIQTGQEGKILTDQKLYGLWGLYSVPARAVNKLALERRSPEC